jgi:hypothetical protein
VHLFYAFAVRVKGAYPEVECPVAASERLTICWALWTGQFFDGTVRGLVLYLGISSHWTDSTCYRDVPVSVYSESFFIHEYQLIMTFPRA